MKNREELEGKLNKGPQKLGRIFRGGGKILLAGQNVYPRPLVELLHVFCILEQ